MKANGWGGWSTEIDFGSRNATTVTVPGGFLSHILLYHRDKEGVVHSLQGFDLSETILKAISRGERSVSTRCFSNRDLRRLRGMGIATGSDELDLVVEFPWDAGSFMTIVTKANDTQLRRRVLVMALDRIRRTATLSRILAGKGLATCTVRENPYLKPGHEPFENFVESLLAVTDVSTPTGEKLFELFLKSAADEADQKTFRAVEKAGLLTVFHGTNHAVMDAILKSGLNPNLRSNHLKEDYFGLNYQTSLHFTKKKTYSTPTSYKLLVFMIITKPDDDLERCGAVTVVSNSQISSDVVDFYEMFTSKVERIFNAKLSEQSRYGDSERIMKSLGIFYEGSNIR